MSRFDLARALELLPRSAAARIVACGVIALVAMELGASSQARLFGIRFEALALPWVVLVGGGFMLVSPGLSAPLGNRRTLVTASVLAVSAVPVHAWLAATSSPTEIRLHVVQPWDGADRGLPAVPVTGSFVADALELERLTAERFDIGLAFDGLVWAPQTGIYVFHYACDDACTFSLGSSAPAPVEGRGELERHLQRGFHPLRISYAQGLGPASFQWSWDRPAWFEPLGLRHFLGHDRELMRGAGVDRPATVPGVALILAMLWWAAAVAFAYRCAELAWADVRLAWALVAVATATFLGWTVLAVPDVSHVWLGLAVAVVTTGWVRASRRSWDPAQAVRVEAVIFVVLVLTTLLNYHLAELNGPWYWKWGWHRLPAPIFATMGIALVPLTLAHLARRRGRVGLGLVILVLVVLSLQLAKRTGRLSGFAGDVAATIAHPDETSYFTDAASFTSLRDWLSRYPDLLSSFQIHSKNKPPAPILFFVPFRSLFEEEDVAALASGLALFLLATLSVPSVYALSRSLGHGESSAFAAASLMALLPGYLFFAPSTDAFYPVLTCALVGSWVVALRQDRPARATIFGLVLSLVLFVTYSLLVLGYFLAGYTLLHVLTGDGSRRDKVVAASKQVATALGTVVIVYGLLFLLTGFDPVRTFVSSLAHQGELLTTIPRPYPQTVWFDLTDAALGVGWVCSLVAVFHVLSTKRQSPSPARLGLALLFLSQFLVVALTGLLPGETARVWIFLFPLLCVPAGYELARWSAGPRIIAYGAQWFLLANLLRNMGLGT